MTPLYTVDPVKKSSDSPGFFFFYYFSSGPSRHQSLKDKRASLPALTLGICRRFFLQRPARRFIILSNFHHFIVRDARFLDLFFIASSLCSNFFSSKLLSISSRWLEVEERRENKRRGSCLKLKYPGKASQSSVEILIE